MPDPPTRSLRRRWRLLGHRVAVPVARGWLWLPRLRRAPARAAPKVTILLLHAWGMGGATRTMLNVAAWLARRYEVEVVSLLRKRDRPFFAFPPGVVVTAADDTRRRRDRARRPAARPPARVPAGAGRSHDPLDDAVERGAARAALRASRPDVLIGTRASLNLLVAGARGAPALVASEHTAFAAHRPRVQREMWRRYRSLDAVVVLGEVERAPFEELLRGATPVRVIPNSIPRQRGGAARLDRPVVVTAGRLAPVKGYDRLIRAFTWVAEAHPGWRLRICGRGGQRRELAALIAELRLEAHVELVGAVRDVEAELEAASIFVLSSRIEGLPLALLEAMAQGPGRGELRIGGAGADRGRRRRPARAGVRRAGARAGDLRADRVGGAAAAAGRGGPAEGRGVRDRRRGAALGRARARSCAGVAGLPPRSDDRGPRAASLADMTSFRADVEGLRAVAIAIVVLAHADVGVGAGGYVGVDVFFVISGFLITQLLVAELDRTRARVGRALLRTPGQAADAAGADRDRRGRGRRVAAAVARAGARPSRRTSRPPAPTP